VKDGATFGKDARARASGLWDESPFFFHEDKEKTLQRLFFAKKRRGRVFFKKR
jgi:hypothetical protein